MSYQFKGQVKYLTIEASTSEEDTKEKYIARFFYKENIEINCQKYGIAYVEDLNTVTSLKSTQDFIILEKTLFDFISQHSTECLIIKYKLIQENKMALDTADAGRSQNNNGPYIVTGVTLSYE